MTTGLGVEWQQATTTRYENNEPLTRTHYGVSLRWMPFAIDSGSVKPLLYAGPTTAFTVPGKAPTDDRFILEPGESFAVPQVLIDDPARTTATLAEWAEPSAYRITVLSADASGATIQVDRPTLPALREHTEEERTDRAPSCKVRRGSALANRLMGTRSCDRLFGMSGADFINGRQGADVIDGGAGNDRLIGGPGRDQIRGGAGNDKILARDGARDRITCGPGRDIVTVDRVDRVTRDCERVLRR